MYGGTERTASIGFCALALTVFFFSTHVQAQESEGAPQLAAAAIPSAADACLQALDRPVVDPARLIVRCTVYLDTTGPAPGEQGAAHLVRAAAYRDLGDEARARADDQAAVLLYSSVIDATQPYPEFVFRRGTAYHALGDIQHALLDYNLAIQLNPWNVVAFADRGLLLSRYRSQFNLAAADFDQALTLSPDNVDFLILRGDTYAAQGKYAAALADLDRAVTLAPRNPDAYVHRASAYSRESVTDKALQDYAKALSIDADNVDALVNRAAIYSESGDGTSAIADLDHALKARPGNSIALYNRGYAHFVEHDYDSAIADYSAAIKVAPDLGIAYANRCLSAALAGRDKAAVQNDCDRAVQLLPARPDIRETLGFVDLKYGDNIAALDQYDAALKLSDNRPLALYGRGIARTRTGDVAAGGADQQAARALYPNIDREFAPFDVE
jgi:tetratricopeptide (TPR) repeat protein